MFNAVLPQMLFKLEYEKSWVSFRKSKKHIMWKDPRGYGPWPMTDCYRAELSPWKKYIYIYLLTDAFLMFSN
jgi:hypothetical protein